MTFVIRCIPLSSFWLLSGYFFVHSKNFLQNLEISNLAFAKSRMEYSKSNLAFFKSKREWAESRRAELEKQLELGKSLPYWQVFVPA